MPVPNLPEKYESEAIVQPADMLAVRLRTGKFPNLPPPDGMTICMRADILRRLRWRFRLRKIARTLDAPNARATRTNGRQKVYVTASTRWLPSSRR